MRSGVASVTRSVGVGASSMATNGVVGGNGNGNVVPNGSRAVIPIITAVPGMVWVLFWWVLWVCRRVMGGDKDEVREIE